MQLFALGLAGIFLYLGWVSDDCRNKESCSECIQTPNCMWCGKPENITDENGEQLSRCIKRSDEVAFQWCIACGTGAGADVNINDPENYFETLINKELSTAGVGLYTGTEEEVVQIRPQRVAMRLRVEQAQNMVVRFRQAEDFPLDVYYIVDLSKSMEDKIEYMLELGYLLSEELQSITTDFRLGFGSLVPAKQQHPCQECGALYGFQNQLSLTANARVFREEVTKIQVSAELDAPLVGLDAIMQAIVCQEHIGWRRKARRVLVFATNSGVQYTEAGKPSGTIEPNDGNCHLDSRGEYTHSTLQDYPSLAQINQVLQEHKINIIFAATDEQSSVYARLSDMIIGSSRGVLSADSYNVVELVRYEFRKLTVNIEMRHNATNPVSITFYSKCRGSVEKKTDICKGLYVGDQVDFRVEVRLTKYPKDRKDWNQLISIYPSGLRERLLLDLDMICECQQVRPGIERYIPIAEECNYHGTYQSGICECNPGYFGHNCEIDANASHDDSTCRETNSSAICSGSGSCNAGNCHCHERHDPAEMVYGRYCECTNFLCERQNTLLCSGPDHGHCECNKCECYPGWGGPSCSCQDSQDNCINPDDHSICSGNGACDCNRCKCYESDGGRYSGKWCEDCPTCKGKCVAYKACVQCQAFFTGELTREECYTSCTLFNVTRVGVAQAVSEGEHLCTFFDDDDCRFTFVYGYDEYYMQPYVFVQSNLECPPPRG